MFSLPYELLKVFLDIPKNVVREMLRASPRVLQVASPLGLCCSELSSLQPLAQLYWDGQGAVWGPGSPHTPGHFLLHIPLGSRNF